jgi:hypothetical protein
MLGSNQRPLPCESSVKVCLTFLQLTKCLQTNIFLRQHFSWHCRLFTRLAAQTQIATFGLLARSQALWLRVLEKHFPIGTSIYVVMIRPRWAASERAT